MRNFKTGDVTGKFDVGSEKIWAITSYGIDKGNGIESSGIIPYTEKLRMMTHFWVNIRDIEVTFHFQIF